MHNNEIMDCMVKITFLNLNLIEALTGNPLYSYLYNKLPMLDHVDEYKEIIFYHIYQVCCYWYYKFMYNIKLQQTRSVYEFEGLAFVHIKNVLILGKCQWMVN